MDPQLPAQKHRQIGQYLALVEGRSPFEIVVEINADTCLQVFWHLGVNNRDGIKAGSDVV